MQVHPILEVSSLRAVPDHRVTLLVPALTNPTIFCLLLLLRLGLRKVGDSSAQTAVVRIVVLLLVLLSRLVARLQLLPESALLHRLLLIVSLRYMVGSVYRVVPRRKLWWLV